MVKLRYSSSKECSHNTKGKPEGESPPAERKKKMYNVIMEVNGEEYVYGKYTDRNKANEIAMQIRDERNVDTSVYEAIDERKE